jgi:uncharacterized protein YkwD
MGIRPAARHRAPRSRRRSLAILSAVLLIPAALAAVYLARGPGGSSASLTGSGLSRAGSPRAASATSPAARTVSTAGTSGAQPRAPAGQRHQPSQPPVTASPALSPGGASLSPSPQASSPPPGQQATVATQVLAMINQARAQAGLPLYSLSSGLDDSAGAHNARMAAGCGLSHQCPGEPPLGTRETDAGVNWTSAGENIGEGGPVADTTTAMAQMALGLTQDMLNEKPPDDGHRLNILSSAFQIIGIAVFRDSSGTVWMTQDFAN